MILLDLDYPCRHTYKVVSDTAKLIMIPGSDIKNIITRDKRIGQNKVVSFLQDLKSFVTWKPQKLENFSHFLENRYFEAGNMIIE